MADADPRTGEIDGLKKTLMQHREMETKLKNLRESVSDLGKEYQKTEDDLQALQVGVQRDGCLYTRGERRDAPPTSMLLLLLLRPSTCSSRSTIGDMVHHHIAYAMYRRAFDRGERHLPTAPSLRSAAFLCIVPRECL